MREIWRNKNETLCVGRLIGRTDSGRRRSRKKQTRKIKGKIFCWNRLDSIRYTVMRVAFFTLFFSFLSFFAIFFARFTLTRRKDWTFILYSFFLRLSVVFTDNLRVLYAFHAAFQLLSVSLSILSDSKQTRDEDFAFMRKMYASRIVCAVAHKQTTNKWNGRESSRKICDCNNANDSKTICIEINFETVFRS